MSASFLASSRRRRLSRLAAAHFLTAALALPVLGFLAGCGGGGGGASAQAPGSSQSSQSSLVQVVLTPGQSTLAAGAPLNLTATVSGSSQVALAWSVNGVLSGNSAVGTITGSGTSVTYTAPTVAGTYTISAASTADTQVCAVAVVTVPAPASAPAPVTVTVTLSPGASVLASAGTLAFTATVTGTSATGVNWSVDGIAQGNATVGTITGTGATVTYTAPAAAGSHTVAATSAAAPTQQADSVVTVQAPVQTPVQVAAPVAVTVTPGTASLKSGGTVAITAVVTGSTNTAVTWAVDGVTGGNATVGTLSGSGLGVTYAAPASAGSHSVTATSSADGTKSASTSITVAAPVAVAVNPTSASLNTGGTVALTASVTGSSDTAVTWAVDGVTGGNATVGTIAGSGLGVTYTAPASAGSHSVTATSVADSTRNAATAVSVLAPAVVVTASPASASLAPNGAVSLTATVAGSSNSAVTWTVDGVAGGNATVGRITGTGDTVTYTAPATTGTHTVAATSAANSASSASSVISVQGTSSSVTVALAQAGSTTVNGSGTMLFTATVTGSSNTAVTWSVDGITGGNATVGTLKGIGNVVLYTAPAAPGSHTVTAISSADTSKSAAKAITVASTAYTAPNGGKLFNAKTGYGATGNGSTDDTAALQNAINAAGAAGGGIVEVPSGTYMINAGHSGEFGLEMASNVYLQLDAGSTIRVMAGAPGQAYAIAFVGGISNAGIIGSGTIDGNKAVLPDQTVENIYLSGCSNIVLTGFTDENAGEDGIYIYGWPTSYNGGAQYVSNVLIYGVTCVTNGRNGISPVGVEGLVVRDSTFSNQTSNAPFAGIDVEPNAGESSDNIQIFNCTFANNKGPGLSSAIDDDSNNAGALLTNLTYAYNSVTSCGDYGMLVENSTGPVNFIGNVISNSKAGVVYNGYGLMLRGDYDGVKNVSVLYNTITNSAADGIYINSATATIVEDNTITGSAGMGIDNTSGSAVTISGNTESGNAGGN